MDPSTAQGSTLVDDVPTHPRPPAEVRQRWRVTYRRRADPTPPAAREVIAAWEAGLAASGLPVAGLDLPVPRPRLVFGAPLPPGMGAERELLDIFLVARLPVVEVRDAIRGAMPPGHELVDVRDAWLGEPALPGQVAAADYAVHVRAIADQGPDLAALRAGCEQLLASTALPRTRDKGGRAVSYDLRPLLADVTASSIDLDGLVGLRLRTRFDPERGVGRPEEVVAALGDIIGARLEILDVVRERLLLSQET